MSTHIVNENLQNTDDYLEEVSHGSWLLAEAGATEVDDGKLCRGCIISYPKGELAVVMSCQEHRLALVLPISAYHAPACDQEILLPESRYVVSTWDVRYQRLATLKQGWVIEMLGEKDFALLFAHYKAVHNQCAFPSGYGFLLGASLSSLEEEKRQRVLDAMHEQAMRFDVTDFAQPVSTEEFIGKEEIERNIVQFTPQPMDFGQFTSMPNAAAHNPETQDNNKNNK